MIRATPILFLFLALLLIAAPFAHAQEAKDAPKEPTKATKATKATANQPSDDSSAPKDDEPAKADESAKAESEGAVDQWKTVTKPLIILGIGIVVVLGLIIVWKVNAFIALITAAVVVSLCADGDIGSKISRVAQAFGNSAGGIAIVIALAAVIGKCMLDSGAADRIVQAFVGTLGEKRSPVALMGSGFVLAVPVFFDTVFYLLVPLARSLHRRTGRNYLKYIMAIAAGGAITHTLVPPTPGPLLMASELGFDVGLMILIGGLVAIPAAFTGLIYSSIADRFMDVPMRPLSAEPESPPIDKDELPSLFISLLPVLLPVMLISTKTVLTTLADNEHAARMTAESVEDWFEFSLQLERDASQAAPHPAKRLKELLSEEDWTTIISASGENFSQKAAVEVWNLTLLPNKDFYTKESFIGFALNPTAEAMLGKKGLRMKKVDAERMNRSLLESIYPDHIKTHDWNRPLRKAANASGLFGDANFALLLSTIIALTTLAKQRGLTRTETARAVEGALMSGGVIILITAGGGAFGAMLQKAEIGEAIRVVFSDLLTGGGTSLVILSMAFLLAMVLKIAQGSSTVAMIVGSSMMAGIVDPSTLNFHPVYIATSIGGGSLVGSWMNDSGFWIFAKMGGLTEAEALKSWTPMLTLLGLVSFGMSILLANILPLV